MRFKRQYHICTSEKASQSTPHGNYVLHRDHQGCASSTLSGLLSVGFLASSKGPLLGSPSPSLGCCFIAISTLTAANHSSEVAQGIGNLATKGIGSPVICYCGFP